MTSDRWHSARVTAWAACLTLLPVFAGNAAAQPSGQPPPPQQTSATYEDWIVRCEIKPGPPRKKSCEMVQFTQVKGQSGVLTQIAIGQPAKGQPIPMVIQVPISVWLPTGVRLTAGGKDEGLQVAFKVCVPNACIANLEVKDDIVRKLRTATEQGKLSFKDANQRDVALPVSFKGFNAAYEALSKE